MIRDLLGFFLLEILGVRVRYYFFKMIGNPKTLKELRGGELSEIYLEYSFWNVLIGVILFLIILFSLLFVILPE